MHEMNMYNHIIIILANETYEYIDIVSLSHNNY